MRINHNPPRKTLGPDAADLVMTLHGRGRRVFTLADVADVTGLGKASSRSFARKLVARGIATRLRPGLFILVPFELGREREYLGNPYVVARELAGERPHYISHASAMDIHGMVTQPQLVVYVASPAPMRPRTILGTEFRFVRCKRAHLFGTTERWVDKQDKVVVSDPERTVIDGLKQPEHCGGVSEVAKGLQMRSADIDAKKLVDYALRLKVGAVIRRLGYLMEVCGLGTPADLERLRKKVTAAYALLDPVLPPEGMFLARWRIRLNVSREEIEAGGRT